MKKIAVPTEDIVPLNAIATGVVGLRIVMVNVFAVQGPSGWVLIDAGLSGSAARIERWARNHFGPTPPRAILLTHAHFDHVGALHDLLETWDVPVFAHHDELPYLTGTLAYPPPDPTVGGGLMARMAALYPNAPIDVSSRVTALPDDGTIAPLPGWRVIQTPGHTAGHVSFFRELDRMLIAGDAFCTTRQESLLAAATQRPELHGPPAYFTSDWDAACESVRRLSVLTPAVLAPGHGQPMSGAEATAGLRQLAEHFDEIARPDHGRYVTAPRRR